MSQSAQPTDDDLRVEYLVANGFMASEAREWVRGHSQSMGEAMYILHYRWHQFIGEVKKAIKERFK